MKKVIKLTILLLLIINPLSSLADETGENTDNDNTIKVRVSEFVPGANCECSKTKEGDGNKDTPHAQCIEYICKVKPGFSQVQNMMSDIIKIFTALTTLAGVLFIVINGILLSMGGMDTSMKEAIKGRIIKTLGGLVLLLLSGVILTMIAPWIYT